ncbi:MAG: ferritin-like domain-containing protein [Oscillospiraceae bacterium]|nr:ferritin-like domain-containing protein [Oscillospiraceae bacterium]
MELQNTKTLENLMRALAGESLARNRYELAAEAAEKEKLPVLSAMFRYTAGQEREHAEVFAQILGGAGVDNVEFSGGFPVDRSASVLSLLAAAARNEEQEHSDVYPAFAATARQEGFEDVARKFELIAQVEKCHAGRFEAFRKLLAENRLFVSDVACGWICLNCGHELNAKDAPGKCPICGREGFFLRVEMSPYSY